VVTCHFRPMLDQTKRNNGPVSESPPLPARNIPAMALTSAEKFATVTALIEGDRRWTYAELGEGARMTIAAALALGVKKGDRVGLWGPNTSEWIYAALGILGAGGILVPLNTRWSAEEIAYALHKADASALFVSQGFLGLDQLGSLRAAAPSLRATETVVMLEGEVEGGHTFGEFLSMGAAISRGQVETSVGAIEPEDPSDIMFTSGTTGRPKGVVLRHGTSLQLYSSLADLETLQPGDVYLIIPPFFHCFGYKAGWMACLLKGVTMIPQKTFVVDEVLDRIQNDKVSVILGPPTVFTDILHSSRLSEIDCSSLRVSCPSAASVPVELIERLSAELGFDVVLNAYGLTEAHGAVSMCHPGDDPALVANFAGPPLAGCEVKIVDAEGAELAANQQGEVLVRGYNLMTEYYEEPQATAEAIDAEGWLHTGDIGLLNDVGYLKITDRKKDMIITGGFNVYPAEVERVLLLDDNVGEAAVVAALDDRMGEVGIAFVVPRPGTTIDGDALLTRARQSLAGYKVPREIRIVESLPRNASLKVLKHVLRAQLRAHE
jgi:acyl-CoA synthetase (AMP-forming)/AMP-acid ligase II